jgi:hypothetical protein
VNGGPPEVPDLLSFGSVIDGAGMRRVQKLADDSADQRA